MHELGIAQNILDILISEAAKRNAKVKAVKLTVGRMSGIVPESLEFILQCISKGTVAEGVAVAQTVIDPILLCNSCDEQFTVEDLDFFCPKCGSGDCQMKEGRDLIVETITLEEGKNGD